VTEPIRVLTADDQRVVREGLALILGLLPGVQVVGTAADGEEVLALAHDLEPDVVLMDLRMPAGTASKPPACCVSSFPASRSSS
jgi:DNA-binding NarL/FixJ family response regulator